MGIFALISTVLEILKEFLTWQVALAKISARKLAYDIDQAQIAKGRELLAKIDAARNVGDLAAVALLLDDAAANALYGANCRSSIPELPGPDVGVSGGIPATPAPSSRPDNSTESGKSVPRAQPVNCGIDNQDLVKNFINLQPKPPTKE